MHFTRFSSPSLKVSFSSNLTSISSSHGRSLSLRIRRSAVAAQMETSITITRPDDWHLHLRDGDLLHFVLPHSVRQFGRAIVMPNLKPPITTTAKALDYRESILKALPRDSDFTPLMTLYLTDNTSPEEIKIARNSGVVFAVKLYPAGATTNSQDGVTDIFGKCLPVLEEMVKQEMPLLVHGEITDPSVDTFDRERVFIETILAPLVEKLPNLKIVMEQITTSDAVNFIESCKTGWPNQETLEVLDSLSEELKEVQQRPNLNIQRKLSEMILQISHSFASTGAYYGNVSMGNEVCPLGGATSFDNSLLRWRNKLQTTQSKVLKI